MSYVSFSEVWSALGQDLTYMISDPEVIRRKQLAGGRRSSMSSMSGMSGMSGRDSPGVMSRSKSSTSVTSSYYDHAADDTYDACNAGESRASLKGWMERDVPQPQPPPEELHTTQRRRAMLASASTQSLLGHHTPDHTAASTEAKRPSDRPSVRRSASGSDTAYYLDADNGVYYDCGIQYSDDHHDASPALAYRSEQVP